MYMLVSKCINNTHCTMQVSTCGIMYNQKLASLYLHITIIQKSKCVFSTFPHQFLSLIHTKYTAHFHMCKYIITKLRTKNPTLVSWYITLGYYPIFHVWIYGDTTNLVFEKAGVFALWDISFVPGTIFSYRCRRMATLFLD